MTSVSLQARPTNPGRLRPLNILRDLPKVADLIELCFASNMDREGRSYIQQMRRASRDASFLRWASNTVEGASMPLTGFVWEQDGRIIGNASLVPFRHKGRRIYLIANVATHPDYRRRGIARMLTEQTIQLARQRGANELWLHVREENPSAIKMYADLGFVERARRRTWRANSTTNLFPPSNLPIVTRRFSRYWPQQKNWLNQLHREELAWYRSWDWKGLKPGMWNWLYRAFVEFEQRQWAVLTHEGLQGVLAWLPTYRSTPLWLACAVDSNETAITALLIAARADLGHQRKLILELPAGVQERAVQAAGFNLSRTLVWMRASGETR